MTRNLKTRLPFSGILLFLLSSFLFAGETITHQDLSHRTQELLDGISTGDGTAHQKYFAEDCLFFDEKGRSLSKSSLVTEVGQLPEGYQVGLKQENAQSRIFEHAAIFSYDVNEDLVIFGQRLGAKYHFTDTWIFRDAKWQIAASQGFRYYGDPAMSEVDTKQFSEAVGTYELAPGHTVAVSLQDEHLYYQRGNNPRELLLPEATGIFFRKGVEGRILFHYGKDGKVDYLISRRNHEDLIWKRIP
jgi:Domain of unknown function (DUF4440)/Domain of unknown function (DUF3471)